MFIEVPFSASIRIPVSESPGVPVDNEEQLEEAIKNGRSAWIRGAGNGGRVVCKRSKRLPEGVNLIGPGELIFDLPLIGPGPLKLIEFTGNGNHLKDLRISCTRPLGHPIGAYALAWPDWESAGNGVSLRKVEIYNVSRALSKDGGPASKPIVGVRIDDCYFHSFDGYGAYLQFGFDDLEMSRTKVFGRLAGEKHRTGNAVACGINSVDCRFLWCEFGAVDRMGFESTIADYTGAPTTQNLGTTLFHCAVRQCGHFGISIGHCKGGWIDQCDVEGVVGIGLEYSAQRNDPSWGTIGVVRVNGVSGDGWVTGVSIDKVIDTHLRGVEVKNITSKRPTQTTGVNVIESTGCSVQGAKLCDAGQYQLQFHQGQAPNAYCENSAFGNEFRRTVPVADGRAIRNFNTILVARMNTTWQKRGQSNNFEANCRAPAGTWCDDPAGPVLAGGFRGSNYIVET